MMNHRRFEKAAEKIVAVFTDGSITNHDLMYVAFYTVIQAYPEQVLDRLLEYAEHVKWERERIGKEKDEFIQDTLF